MSHATHPKKSHDLVVPCFMAPGGKMKAVMPEVHITDPGTKTITLQNVDADGNPVPLVPADVVTTTLTSDSTAFFPVTPGADPLHYGAQIAGDTPFGTVANLSATETGTIKGAPANFTSSVKVFIEIQPQPTAVDLTILIS